VDLEEFAAKADMDKAWRDLEAGVGKVTALLNRTEGPFFAGEEVGYVDFVWGGMLLFVKLQGEDVWEKWLEKSGDQEAHERLLEGLAPWTKRND
jgi:glutathione S-transferase